MPVKFLVVELPPLEVVAIPTLDLVNEQETHVWRGVDEVHEDSILAMVQRQNIFLVAIRWPLEMVPPPLGVLLL